MTGSCLIRTVLTFSGLYLNHENSVKSALLALLPCIRGLGIEFIDKTIVFCFSAGDIVIGSELLLLTLTLSGIIRVLLLGS